MAARAARFAILPVPFREQRINQESRGARVRLALMRARHKGKGERIPDEKKKEKKTRQTTPYVYPQPDTNNDTAASSGRPLAISITRP